MNHRKLRGLFYTIPGIVIGAMGAQSCGNNAIAGLADDLKKQCGLECGPSVVDGNVSVSGVASVDSFFNSVVHFQTTADTISGGIQAELDAIGASVGAKARSEEHTS